MTEFLDSGYQLWDFAGVDGLQFAKALFGETSGRIAPFQSFEFELLKTDTFTINTTPHSVMPRVFDSNETRCSLNGCLCSVLRLGEGNFRISLQGEATVLEQAIAQLQPNYQIWAKRCEWMGAIAIPETLGLNLLPKIAIPKPPHRLEGLQSNCAVPARIDGISVLIWRHQLGQPAFELHIAIKDIEAVQAKVV